MAYNFKVQMAADIQRILTTDFAQDIIFTPPLGAPVTVSGYTGKHALNVNELGVVQVNSKEVYCNVTEKSLTDKGYITRDSNGDLITFANHLVIWTDIRGQIKTYIVQKGKSSPDENMGTIVFTLGYYKTGTPPPSRIIYGWTQYKVLCNIVVSPDPFATQTLGNGDIIPLEYSLNDDGYNDWAPGSYNVGDHVNNIGSGYICAVANSDSVFDASKWTAVAARYNTLTIPYLSQYPGINVLTPFIDNNSVIADDNVPVSTIYNSTSNKFDLSAYGGFSYTDKIQFNATLPIFIIP